MTKSKYVFPPKAQRPTFTVHTQADIDELPLGTSFNLMIRGKNLTIPFEEILGDCIIRQTDCQFPNLKKVWGMLSVDAANSNFPKLSVVVGNCNLHEVGTSIPKLREIWGKVKIYNSDKYTGIRFAKLGRGKCPPKLASKKDIVISHESHFEKLHQKKYFHLTVKDFNGEIPCRVIYGNLIVEDCAASFPFLECVFGDIFIVSTSDRNRYDQYGKRIKKKKIEGADNPNLFPVLERVFGRLSVNKTTTAFPKLQQTGMLLLEAKCKHINLDTLYWIDKHMIDTSQHFIRFPALKEIQGNIHIERQYHTECLSLEHIGGNANMYMPVAPALKKLDGYIKLFKYSPVLPSLQKIGGLVLKSKNHLDKLPSIKEINEVIYETGSIFPEKSSIHVNHALFTLTNQITIEEAGFYIDSFWGSHIWEVPRIKRKCYPFSMLVALLKLRHNSFNNFQTRQLFREWPQYKGKHWETLIGKVKALWDETPKYNVTSIFKLKNRNLRRFCFTFVGVEEIMRILKAERMSTEGIEMNYFRYDDEGNEFPIAKHNIYELYRAKTESIPDLNVRWSWRRRNSYVYAVKCWCTSTEKAHWLWVEEDYISDPLTAIASTFRIHENVIPYIKCLKRQGDILICEMQEEVVPKGRIRPLTKKEYFSLLKAES